MFLHGGGEMEFSGGVQIEAEPDVARDGIVHAGEKDEFEVAAVNNLKIGLFKRTESVESFQSAVAGDIVFCEPFKKRFY